LKKQSKSSLEMFSLQLEYFASEAILYTYQNCTLEELKYVHGLFSHSSVQSFYKNLKNALDYAFNRIREEIFSTLRNSPNGTFGPKLI